MTVIFIHGSGAYGGVWRYQTDCFADSDSITLPGHLQGQTLNSVEEYGDWLREYISGRGYKDVVLAGHSLGGAVALMYALKYPQDLMGIVVMGSGARLRVDHSYLAVCERAVKGDLREWHQLLEAMYRLTPEDYRREVMHTLKSVGPGAMLSDFLCCDRFDLMDTVQDIELPVLIICGELDIMTPVKYAGYLGDRVPNSRLAIVPEGTHFVFAEKPEAVNEAIADFLQTISS